MSSRVFRITQNCINTFAEVVGDKNPVHLLPQIAEKTRFKGTIAHGMTALSILNGLLKSINSINNFQVRFFKPIYPGTEVQAELSSANGQFQFNIYGEGILLTKVKGDYSDFP